MSICKIIKVKRPLYHVSKTVGLYQLLTKNLTKGFFSVVFSLISYFFGGSHSRFYPGLLLLLQDTREPRILSSSPSPFKILCQTSIQSTIRTNTLFSTVLLVQLGLQFFFSVKVEGDGIDLPLEPRNGTIVRLIFISTLERETFHCPMSLSLP